MANARPRAYLDYNASAPLALAAQRGISAALTAGAGNPSSIHSEGRKGRSLIEAARQVVAHTLSTDVGRIVFTSGGSEANQLALRTLIRATEAPQVAMSGVEHPSLKTAVEVCRAQIIHVHVDESGRIDESSLTRALEAGAKIVAIQLCNQETGVVQDIAAIAATVAAAGALLHCDAVQALGKIPLVPEVWGLSSMSVSSHKIGGPQGSGALWLSRGLDRVSSETQGQERGRRGGTENVLGIVGFGAALAERGNPDCLQRVRGLCDQLEVDLRNAGLRIFGDSRRNGTCLCISTYPAPADLVVMALDVEGFAVSAGSACSSGKVGPSPVLQAMGLSDAQARCAIRVSLGWESEAPEIDALLAVLPGVIQRIAQLAPVE